MGPRVRVWREGSEVLWVEGLTTDDVARTACSQGVVLSELTRLQGSLEDTYLALTRADSEFRAEPQTHAPEEATT